MIIKTQSKTRETYMGKSHHGWASQYDRTPYFPAGQSCDKKRQAGRRQKAVEWCENTFKSERDERRKQHIKERNKGLKQALREIMKMYDHDPERYERMIQDIKRDMKGTRAFLGEDYQKIKIEIVKEASRKWVIKEKVLWAIWQS